MKNRAFQPENTTVIICCAGMGTRLGIGTTKALMDIDGKPLIIRQLELLKAYDDIRIVVGFQAEKIIQVVNRFRKDVMYAFNYQYESTGVADSLRKALLGAREYIISLDGDVLENADDFQAFLEYEGECLAVSKLTSAEAICASLENNCVIRLSKTESDAQWPGIAKVKREKLVGQSAHVYDVLNCYLPLTAFPMRTREINTQEDYEKAIEWVTGGFLD